MFPTIFPVACPGIEIAHPILGEAILYIEQVCHSLPDGGNICEIGLPELVWFIGMEQLLPPLPVLMPVLFERKVLPFHD